MAAPVTFTADELAALNAAPTASLPKTELTDTEKASLSAAPVGDRPPGAIVSGYGQATLGGVNSGIAHAAGLPVDLYNLVGDATMGRLPAYLADKAGMPKTADWIRKNGYKDIYTGSGQSIVDAEKQAGIGYDAKTPGEQAVKDGVSGATTAAITAPFAPAGALEGLLPRMGAQAIGGASGVVGGKAAQSLNEATGNHVDPTVADLIGAIFGGLGAAGVTNRVASNPSALADDFKAARVNPAFPSDVGNNTMKQGVANRIGAQGFSKESAAETQRDLRNYATNTLDNFWSKEPNSPLGGYGDGTDAATVQKANSQSAQGAQIANTVTKNLSILDSRGDSILRNNAARTPSGAPAYPQSDPRVLPYMQDMYDRGKRVLDANPESATIPSWLAEQSKLGPDRLNDTFDVMSPKAIGRIGQDQLRNVATTNGAFNLDDLMGYWKSIPGDTKEALTQDPAVREGMQRTERLYDATQNSRDFMNQTKTPITKDPFELLTGLGAIGGSVAGKALGAVSGGTTGDILGAGGSVLGAAAGGLPIAANLAARAGQRSGVAASIMGPRMDAPLSAMQGAIAGGAAASAFPDVYTPPVAQPTPTPGQVQSFLGNATPQVAQAYVSSKLGPQVASQIPTDPQGAKAAIFSLFADPSHRQALTGEEAS